MALESVSSVQEFNILSYANAANASASNVVISVEIKYLDENGVLQVVNRPNVNFITGVWNHMAGDASGREILKRHIQELAQIRAMVFAGVATYADYV